MNKWMIWGYHYFWKHPNKSYPAGEISLVFQNYPVIPWVWRCLDPLKAEPQEVFGDLNIYSQGVWKTRELKHKNCLKVDWDLPGWFFLLGTGFVYLVIRSIWWFFRGFRLFFLVGGCSMVVYVMFCAFIIFCQLFFRIFVRVYFVEVLRVSLLRYTTKSFCRVCSSPSSWPQESSDVVRISATKSSAYMDKPTTLGPQNHDKWRF